MKGYSKRSQELAQELAEKVARNVSKSGRKVVLSETGRYSIVNVEDTSGGTDILHSRGTISSNDLRPRNP
ncbi:hypothetical protein HQQ80_17095 [Microbacteriaceae bacterium VKM Ac-2855]|nr:hypothetical protein [Microbacteriaceae bacterium VKM Ac-2855]